MPALHCAHLVLPDALDRKRVREVPVPAGHDWSGLGVAAAVAAWRDGDEWNAALRARLGEQRSLLTELLPALLPQARVRPLEATYLAWLDLRAYGVADPAAEALRHGVRLAPGDDYQPGLPGHVRLNLATSADRLRTIVERLATALSRSSSSGRR
jgi:cystathionine beta-lyase